MLLYAGMIFWGGLFLSGCAALYLQWRDWRALGAGQEPSLSAARPACLPFPEIEPDRFSLLCGLVVLVHFFLPLALVAVFQFSLDGSWVFVLAVLSNAVVLGVVWGLWPLLRGFVLKSVRHGLLWNPVSCFAGTFALAAAAALAVRMVQWLLKTLFGLKIAMPPQDTVEMIIRNREDGAFLALVGVAVVIMAPLAEEVFFRGALYSYFRRHLGVCRGLCATGLIFGLVHFNVAAFLPLALMGAYFCLVREKTGGLLAPIVAHGLFNLQTLLTSIFFPEW